MTQGPEYKTTEKPFLDQLARLGWRVITGNLDEPSTTGRESFREVLLKDDLRRALRRINTRDGEPWLDDERLSQAVSELEHITAPRVMEANEKATELLLEGTTVAGLDDWEHGRARGIHYIDWEDPENNDFLAVNQLRVDCPQGQAKAFITPDIVLFINGIPIGVVECKTPGTHEPIANAVDQLRRYANQRKADGEVEGDEGNQRLFFTNQLLIASCFDDARLGSIGAGITHFLEWKDPSPISLEQVRAELGKQMLSSQNRLIAGVLRKEHLIDIIRHFVLFKTLEGRRIKVVPRYQQFRAVQAAVKRLLTGKTRLDDGENDQRGGIVWHTQGSGKSLTMVFLIRKMRSSLALRSFKVVVITDRTDLQRQLSDDMAETTGETVNVGKSIAAVKGYLSVKGPGIVFAMIQKYNDRDFLDTGDVGSAPKDFGELPVLNEDESILCLVDEAHRSHSNALHANLLKALPNCARIGFTGTPIILGQKKYTHSIFGEFIDRYTIKESEADGATVPILYEGRTAEGAVADGRDLDQLFEDLFADHSEDELEAIKRKYGTKGAIFEAEKLIDAKAGDMLAHYVENILPNGLKAQVVAYSRRAAIRYQAAFVQARDELVQAAEDLDEVTRALDDEALAKKPRKVRAAVRAWRELALLKTLEFAAIVSPGNNDYPEYKEWTDGAKMEARTARFKKALKSEDESKSDPLAFLIVKSMLLTGFDAPIEGVLYLDRPIREAELLQAIARVNRTGHGKQAGIVVDYYGVAKHLKEALSAYSAEDIEGALQSLADEIPKLRDRHQRVLDLFGSRGLKLAEEEDCVAVLKDDRLRAEFTVKLKQFLATLDLVLPRPEGLPYVRDAKALAYIYARSRMYDREGMPQLGKDVGGKVRKLIDDHVISLGIDPKIPPIAITDAKFEEHVERQTSPRAKASEMEHAARHHIKKKMDEDPVYYQKLSERLAELLIKFGEDWEQLALALKDLTQEIFAGRKQDDTGLDPDTEAPFFAVLKAAREEEAPISGADTRWLIDRTRELVAFIRAEVGLVNFWKNVARQSELRGAIFQFIDNNDIVSFDRADELADRLMEMSKANSPKLTKASGAAEPA